MAERVAAGLRKLTSRNCSTQPDIRIRTLDRGMSAGSR